MGIRSEGTWVLIMCASGTMGTVSSDVVGIRSEVTWVLAMCASGTDGYTVSSWGDVVGTRSECMSVLTKCMSGTVVTVSSLAGLSVDSQKIFWTGTGALLD